MTRFGEGVTEADTGRAWTSYRIDLRRVRINEIGKQRLVTSALPTEADIRRRRRHTGDGD